MGKTALGLNGNLRLRTGQPLIRRISRRCRKESPPTHGATPLHTQIQVQNLGISAYARGNRLLFLGYLPNVGNLRLRTGQPYGLALVHHPAGESPPTHGATVPVGLANGVAVGISAYARGNRIPNHAEDGSLRNLRLRTGQPPRRARTPRSLRESPPTHGATVAAACGDERDWGISAYARGNPHVYPFLAPLGGNLRLRTGQPLP